MPSKISLKNPKIRQDELALRIMNSMAARRVEPTKRGRPRKQAPAFTLEDITLPPIRKTLLALADQLSDESHWGKIYVMTHERENLQHRQDGRYPCKIGLSKNPNSRLGGVNTGTYQKVMLEYQSPYAVPFVREDERYLHTLHKGNHIRLEWFYLNEEEIEEIDRYMEVALLRLRIIQDHAAIHNTKEMSAERREQTLQAIEIAYLDTKNDDFMMSQEQLLRAFSVPMANQLGIDIDEMPTMFDKNGGFDLEGNLE